MSLLLKLADRALAWSITAFFGHTFAVALVGLPAGIVDRADPLGPGFWYTGLAGVAVAVACLEIAGRRAGR